MAQDQLFGTLQTAGETLRRRLHYERASIGISGSWNPDASFATLKDNDYTEILNLRMQTIGGYEVRTGYSKYDTGSPEDSLEVLCKCEYRHKIEDIDVYFDMTVYQAADKIRIQGINRAPVSGSVTWAVAFTVGDLPGCNPVATAASAIPANPAAIAACSQFGVNIVITVFGIGTYIVYPTNKTADTWVLRALGKKLSVTPWQINYADTYNGDLFLTLFEDNPATLKGTTGAAKPVLAHHWQAKALLQGSTADPRIPPYQYLAVPLGAEYKRSNNSGFDHTNHKFFTWDAHDIPDPTVPMRATTHLRKAGWGYRFIVKSQFTDPRGNSITYRNEASVDIWVNDTIYCPPQVYDLATQPNGDYRDKQQFDMIGLTTPVSAGEFIFIDHTQYAAVNVRAVASASDLETLANKFIAYYGQKWVLGVWNNNGKDPDNNGFDEAVCLPAMVWLGYRWAQHEGVTDTTDYEEYNFDSTFKDAWFTEVPASFLASAPLCEFKWTDFSTTDGTHANPDFPSDAVEIEVYRTAWTDSDSKLSNNDPAFQPHLYGYVGSIKKDGSLTDNIKDEEIDFALTPDSYDGYLEGQFSGQVVREYSGKIAIANTSTSYYIFDPSGIFPFVIGNVGTGGILLDPLASADLGVNDFYYIQYVDTDGNVSDLVSIPSDPNNFVGDYTIVAIPLPTGYDPSIVAINVWFSHFDGVSTLYRLMGQAAPTDNQFVKKTTDFVHISPTTPSTTGNKTHPKIIEEGGEVMWSNVNEPFDFPPLNARIVRKTGNITAMETVVGELMIFSDTTIDYDNLNSFDPRGEEVSKWVGCVGRASICKVDKIVFIMTPSGLYFAEPGGVVSFPANVQSVVLQYIREQIPGVAPMANARRCSIGYDGKRYELWVHFPASTDLHNPANPAQRGTLPEITIIYKFFNPDITQNTVASFVNYRFDLLTAADSVSANPNGTQNMPQFLTTSDGKLFCSYKETSGGKYQIATIDCDTDTVWPDKTAIEHVYGMGLMNVQKMIREVQIAGDFDCGMTIWHGVPNPLPAPSPTTGWINPLCPAHTITLPANSYNVSFPHRIGATAGGSMSAAEMYSVSPVVRIETTERAGAHTAMYKDLDLLYLPVHSHPI